MSHAPTLPSSAAPDRAVGLWFMSIVALVVVMILVGGATRLTDSGLSIVEWRPVTGAIPPLTEAQWLAELEKYRSTTEYQIQNRGMSMEEFKVIFWWEWGHRQLGRLIGLVYAVGFIVFAVSGRLRGRMVAASVLFALGGLQGAIGWWMVSSGLVGRLDVAPYRLAVHLGLAFIIVVLAWRLAMHYLRPARAAGSGRDAIAWAFAAAVLVQVLLGALVAGNDAGRTYTDWPTLGGEWFPSSYLAEAPWWRNMVENLAAVQFNHRVGGYLVFAFGLWIGWRAWRQGHRVTGAVIGGSVTWQLVVGVITLLNAAPWHLGLLHQGGAVVLWLAAVHFALHARAVSRYRTPEIHAAQASAGVT